MADSSVRSAEERLTKRPLESYNKTWLGFIAVAVVAVVIGAMLAVHALGAGYRHYTAEFLQAASLRPGNPITVAGIPVGEVTSMKLDGDHVEAGLKIRDNVALGSESKAMIKVTTILGSRYLALEPRRPGSACRTTPLTCRTPKFPTIFRAALQDATTTFEQVDSDGSRNPSRCWASSSRACPRWCPRHWRTSTPCRRSSRSGATNWASCSKTPNGSPTHCTASKPGSAT